jgi:hypothetical protein
LIFQASQAMNSQSNNHYVQNKSASI